MKTVFFFLSAAFLFFLVIPIRTALGLPEDSLEYHRRAVQALVDTGSGLTSSGEIAIATADVRNYRKADSFGPTTFSLSAASTAISPEGQYRIIFGNVNTSYLQRQWWTQVHGKGSPNAPTVWSRKVSDFSGTFVELIAIQKKHGFTFEVRLLYEGLDRGRKESLARLRLLVSNAEATGLFDKPRTNAQRPKSTPTPLLDVSGKWVGPMTNTKGGKLDNSVLVLQQGEKGEITGIWYSDWKVSNVKRSGDILRWKHLRMQGGCRDYHNQLKLAEDGKSAILTYNVYDRCSKPSRYNGEAVLKR